MHTLLIIRADVVLYVRLYSSQKKESKHWKYTFIFVKWIICKALCYITVGLWGTRGYLTYTFTIVLWQSADPNKFLFGFLLTTNETVTISITQNWNSQEESWKSIIYGIFYRIYSYLKRKDDTCQDIHIRPAFHVYKLLNLSISSFALSPIIPLSFSRSTTSATACKNNARQSTYQQVTQRLKQ